MLIAPLSQNDRAAGCVIVFAKSGKRRFRSNAASLIQNFR